MHVHRGLQAYGFELVAECGGEPDTFGGPFARVARARGAGGDGDAIARLPVESAIAADALVNAFVTIGGVDWRERATLIIDAAVHLCRVALDGAAPSDAYADVGGATLGDDARGGGAATALRGREHADSGAADFDVESESTDACGREGACGKRECGAIGARAARCADI